MAQQYLPLWANYLMQREGWEGKTRGVIRGERQSEGQRRTDSKHKLDARRSFGRL